MTTLTDNDIRDALSRGPRPEPVPRWYHKVLAVAGWVAVVGLAAAMAFAAWRCAIPQ